MKESRNQEIIILRNSTSERFNVESEAPKEDITDRKEDNKENNKEDNKEDDKEDDKEDNKENNKENKKDVKVQKEVNTDRIFKSKFYNDEVIPLLKTKKDRLQNKFKKLYFKFHKLRDKPIYDIIENYSNEIDDDSSKEALIEIDQGNPEQKKEEQKKEEPQKEEQKKEEKIKEEKIKEEKIKEKKRKFLEKRKCGIYTLAFFFLLFYLIGIFQLLDLFDSTKKITGIIFKSFFLNKSKENKETFKDYI